MRRSSVDLPQPERPRMPRISFPRSSKVTPSSTTSSPPPGRGNERRRLLTERMGVSGMVGSSAYAEALLGMAIERPPEQPVEQHDKGAHDSDAEDNSRVVGFGGS